MPVRGIALSSLCIFVLSSFSVALEPHKSKDVLLQEQAYNFSRRAYDLFSIVLSGSEGERDTEESAEHHVVFRNGNVQRSWIPPRGRKVTTDEESRLFHHDPFADRISFEMFYGVSDIYEYTIPLVSSSDKSIALPKVIDYRNDVDEKSSTFTVVYDCRNRLSSIQRTAVVSVSVPVLPAVQVNFSLVKTCGGGMHPYIELGVYRAGRDSRLGDTRVRFDAARGYVAGPQAMSTRIYLHLHTPAVTQEFFHPNVSTTSDVLALSTRGPTFGGVLRGGESAVLHVLYECSGVGAARVSVVIPIPPFRPLRATWTKDCGGGRATALRIGSMNFSYGDVVHAGTPSEYWGFDVDTLATTRSLAARMMPTLNASTIYKDFFLSNDGDPLQLGSPAFTVDRPSVLSLYAGHPPPHLSSIFLTGVDDVLESHTMRRMRFIFSCKKTGVAHVLVTLPIKSFSTIEFGFRKLCKAPRRYTHSSFLRTANSLMSLSILFIALVMAIWCLRQVQSARSSKNEAKSMKLTRMETKRGNQPRNSLSNVRDD